MAMLFSVMSFAAESLQVTLDFSKNTTWGFPAGSGAKTTATKTYTNGDYSITLAGGGSGNGHYWNDQGYLMLGKSGATLTLPAFDFNTTKIVVVGRSGASASTLQNIYVGSTAVSTQTKGSAVTNTYAIAEDYQAAGNVYIFKVSSSHNSQIVKIEIYGEEGGEQGEKVDAPKFSVTESNFKEAFDLTISSAEGTTLKYTTDNTDPKTSATAVSVETNTANVAIPAKSTVVKAVAVKGDLVSVVASTIYAYVNSPETAYTVAEAMEVIDAGLGLENELYVKGEISTIEEYNANYGSITYWIKDEEGNKFECYSGLGLNKAKFTSIDDLVVGSKVVVCGTMKKFNTTYEFNYNNYIVSLELPVAKYTVTATAENGTVTGAGEYIENAEVTLTATPAEGYEFTCWTSGEDTVSTANPYTFAVTANVALVANFKEVVVEEPVEAKLYLTPNANWKKDNARFAAYFFGNGETWVGMTKVDGETDLYEVTIPTDKKYPNVIFCRMNPGAAANNWNNKWNQTSDLVIPTDGKNHYTVKAGTWDKGGGTWSIWPVPTVKTYVDITITVTANAPASIKWANAGDKLADATEYVAMTAGENNTYTYTLAQVDEAKGVDYTIKVGDIVSTTQNTSKNVTVDFKNLLPQVAIEGIDGKWDSSNKMTVSDDYLTASITLPLAAKDHAWKLTIDAAWLGGSKFVITRTNNSVVVKEDANGDGKLTADIAGDYVFTWTYATQTLTVTYPAIPVKYNVTVTAENGTVTGAGEYEENAEATLTATANEGYEFVNWTVGDSIVSTENPYKFTVTADLALVANFKEVVKAIEVNVTDATATSGEWSIDLAGSWNDQALTIKLWQDNTQGFGSYAPNTETGYYILLGAKELTPTTEGVYADNGDGTFTFTCSATEGTTQYNITVTGNNPTQGGGDEEYPIIDDAITNLTFNLDEEPYSCMGGPSEAYGIELYLVLGEEDGMGTFTLTEASEIYVQGSPATFISGYLTDIDTSAPAANAVIVAKLPDGSTFEFHIAMSSTPVDATVIVVENATLAIDSTFLFNNPVSGDVYEYSLTMSGNWTDSTNTTYLVTVEFPVYDPATTEEQERLANIKVGDFAADDAPFLGMVEDFLTITNVNGVITAKGLVSGNGLAFDITISGSLAQDPSTGVESLNGTVAPVKVIENGQIFIIRNGVKYNAQGAQL